MNTQTYIDRLSEFGISRGALASGFQEQSDAQDTVQKRTTRHGYLLHDRKRQVPPPGIVFDDWSHLNPERRGTKGGRPRKVRVWTADPKHPDKLPRPGELTLKQWLVAEGHRRGVGFAAVRHYMRAGEYPTLKLRRVNKRLIFVTP